jgi:hypothetical protein
VISLFVVRTSGRFGRVLDGAIKFPATLSHIVIAVGFNVVAFGAYVALFRGVLGGTQGDQIHRRLNHTASYQITMAGLAATRIFSAAGAGGIVLTYWALRKAGMPRRRATRRCFSPRAVRSSPFTTTRPEVGRSSSVTHWASVDLPAPEGPSRPTISPALTSRSTPDSAATS